MTKLAIYYGAEFLDVDPCPECGSENVCFDGGGAVWDAAGTGG